MQPSSLAELLTKKPYRFHMGLRRGEISDFFQPGYGDHHAELLAQRRHWLETLPERHLALLAEGEPLLEETIESVQSWHALPDGFQTEIPAGASAWERALALGKNWEPDYLLLKADAEGMMRLWGGCVCFPSSWSLEEKIGRPLDVIHSAVPGLNAALGRPIDRFMHKLQPGYAWQRANWGLSRSAELNQHPERVLPRLDANVRLDEVWFRVEHQALVALPKTQGILFGIRIAVHALTEIAKDDRLTEGLIEALETMPEEVAAYKNLAAARPALIRHLRFIH